MNLIESQLKDVDDELSSGIWSDYDILIGGKLWKTHKWIWKLRLCELHKLDAIKEELNSVSLDCAKFILNWLYNDSYCSNEYPEDEMCDVLIEVVYLFSLLEVDASELSSNPLTSLKDCLNGLDSGQWKELVKKHFHMKLKEMHIVFSQSLSDKKIEDIYKDIIDDIAELIDTHHGGNDMNLIDLYIIKKEEQTIAPNENLDTTLTAQMKTFAKAKEFGSSLFEFEGNNVTSCYIPSIVWSQCYNLRDYIGLGIENQTIPMKSMNLLTDISEKSWFQIIDFFCYNSQLDMSDIGYDVFSLYEFFIFRNRIILTEEFKEDDNFKSKLSHLKDTMMLYLKREFRLYSHEVDILIDSIKKNVESIKRNESEKSTNYSARTQLFIVRITKPLIHERSYSIDSHKRII